MAKTIKKVSTEVSDQTPEENSKDDILESDIEIDDLPEEMPKGKSLKDTMKIINKKFGDKTMITLKEIPDFPRLPSGVHAVDYTIGGGFPITHSSCLYGGFSGGKTTLALSTLAVSQVLCMRCYRPSKYCSCSTSPFLTDAAIANVEGTLDNTWAKTIGVDTDRVYPIQAESAEMYIDILDQVLQSDDCGLLVFDSIGALVSIAEMDKAAEASNMGVSAKIITKLVKRVKQRLINETKRGHQVSVLYINQKRVDLTVKFGSNESMAGGMSFFHEQSITLRNGKVSFNDPEKKVYKSKVDTDRDPATKHSIIVHKAKVYTLGASCQYVRSVDYKHPTIGDTSGKVMDFKFLIEQARSTGILGDDPKKLTFMDKDYKTQIELMQQLNKDPQDKLFMSMMIVEKAKQDRLNS